MMVCRLFDGAPWQKVLDPSRMKGCLSRDATGPSLLGNEAGSESSEVHSKTQITHLGSKSPRSIQVRREVQKSPFHQ